jgi:hypothetical protein
MQFNCEEIRNRILRVMVTSTNPGLYKPQDTNMGTTPHARNSAVEMNIELPVCGACSNDTTTQIFTI